ncbi:MAG TPA: 2OG-Fe(II) oxygenase [Bacteroidia bacterium]|nr:2OG-Fe(II) oxygenase [Bacteroidia bacterium]
MKIVRPFKSLPPLNKKELNFDFVDYAWFTGYFTEDEVARIRTLWSSDLADEAEVNNAGQALSRNDLRKSQVMFIRPDGQEWIYDKLAKACIQLNTKRFQFDIRGFQTELQLANYSDQGFFDWHMDFGAGDISNRKLSITVQLSDPDEYEGGDLQFMINQNIHTAPRAKGTAVIFPSFALHRVTPVTKGSRMSIVGWIAGTPYK